MLEIFELFVKKDLIEADCQRFANGPTGKKQLDLVTTLNNSIKAVAIDGSSKDEETKENENNEIKEGKTDNPPCGASGQKDGKTDDVDQVDDSTSKTVDREADKKITENQVEVGNSPTTSSENKEA